MECVKVFISVFYLCVVANVRSAPAEDLVTSLPGIAFEINYKQYSGYFSVSGTRHLHYWFVESQNAPSLDPVILWLNGGPGCSSMEGMLSENGPFHIKWDGKLHYNKYSWNVRANVLYIESPAGVGYSYNDTAYIPGDKNVATDNYNALVEFYKKFPEYKSNPFYITGESYAGMYLPLLAQKIIHGKSAVINFKGMAIGNGLYSYDINDNSLIFYAYYHGLVGERLWSRLIKSCCKREPRRSACNFTNYENINCLYKVADVKYTIQHQQLNQYSLYDDCWMPSTMFSMENVLKNVPDKAPKNLGFVPACINGSAQLDYLNRPEVRKALHISNKAKAWTLCSRTVLKIFKREYFNLKSVFDDIFKSSDIKILLYSGDTDLAVNFLGTQWFVSDLKREVVRPRQPWYVEGQVAGFVDEYNKLSFCTVKGAGHMVPEWRPKFAYYMLSQFIK